jgi:vitamin B12 transporter
MGPWSINASASYSGERFDGTNRLGSYAIAGFSGSYKLTNEWSVLARIDNAFDETYQSVYGYNQPPRSLFVGLRWQR